MRRPAKIAKLLHVRCFMDQEWENPLMIGGSIRVSLFRAWRSPSATSFELVPADLLSCAEFIPGSAVTLSYLGPRWSPFSPLRHDSANVDIQQA